MIRSTKTTQVVVQPTATATAADITAHAISCHETTEEDLPALPPQQEVVVMVPKERTVLPTEKDHDATDATRTDT